MLSGQEIRDGIYIPPGHGPRPAVVDSNGKCQNPDCSCHGPGNSTLPDMLKRVLPGRSEKERIHLLWSCTCYPFAGTFQDGVDHYEKQLKEALAARPDDPIGWVWEKNDKALEEARERGER